MGFGQWLNNFGKTFSDGFHNLGAHITSGANKLWGGIRTIGSNAGSFLHTVQHSAEGIGHELKSGLQTLHQDARDLVGGLGSTWKDEYRSILHTGENLVDSAGQTIRGTASSQSLPLTVGLAAAGALGVLLLARK